MKFYRSLRIGWFELTVTWNRSLKKFIISIGRRNPEFNRFHKDGDHKKPKEWRPYLMFKRN